MSRAERERWAEAHEHWPNLQAFISDQMADCLFGDLSGVQLRLGNLIPELSSSDRSKLASEAFSFLGAFRERHDDRPFLRDAFAVQGSLQTDDRGRGQVGRARIKVVYDALAASIRREQPEWVPA